MSCIDTLRLSEHEQTELLQSLDQDDQRRRLDNIRHHERMSYRPSAGILISLTHPGGSAAVYLVRPRNLSAGGIGFLHGSYLHAGSQCGLALRAPDGSRQTILGRVAWCRHLRGRVHEVGVSFERAINTSAFVNTCLRTASAPLPPESAPDKTPEPQANATPAPAPAAEAAPERETSTPMPRLGGRVLHIEDAVDDQALLQFQLGQLGVEMHTATDAMEALGRLAEESFDLIVTGIWLPGMTGLEVVDQVREQLHLPTPILALTADPTEAVHTDARQRGCNQVLVKPYTFETLVEVLRRYLGKGAGRAAPRRLVSQYWGDQAMRPLIRQFVERLEGQCRQIGEMVASAREDPLLRKLCLELKGSAGSYGYPALSEAARHLYDLVQCNAAAAELSEQHEQLNQLAKAARAGLEPADHDADANP